MGIVARVRDVIAIRSRSTDPIVLRGVAWTLVRCECDRLHVLSVEAPRVLCECGAWLVWEKK